MRVLLVQPYGHWAGSYPMLTKYLANALADQGAEVTVATFDGLLSGHDCPTVNLVSVCSDDGRSTLRALERPLSLGKVAELDSITLTLATLRLARHLAHEQEFDAIQLIDAHPPVLAHVLFGSWVRNQTLVFNLNLPAPTLELGDRQTLFRLLRRGDYRLARHRAATTVLETGPMLRLKKHLYRKSLRRNTIFFVCHSPQVQDSYRGSFFEKRLTCIPWGQATDQSTVARHEARRRLGLAPETKVLLSFGLNHVSKNLDVLFRAGARLGGGYTILYGGKIDDSLASNDPEKLAERYECRERTLIFNRYIAEEEIPLFFAAADVAILSYTRDFIGASGVLTHACAFQLPVIASDIGQLGELVNEHSLGLTFIPEDADSLCEAIKAFFSIDANERKAFERNMSRFSEANSWEEIARRHLTLYEPPKTAPLEPAAPETQSTRKKSG